MEQRIMLMNDEPFAQLLLEHKVGVREFERYIGRQINYDYFDEGLK